MILAVLQARMSSTRLPGKVLRPILGRPMMGRQIDRALRSRRIDRLVVATSHQAQDDPIAEFCAADRIPFYRGSLDDVLARVHGAAERCGPAAQVVRLTADCPLSDWTVIDAAIDLHLRERADLSGNVLKRSYPDGLDVEVMTAAALERACRDAVEPDEREHVTPYFYRHPELFRLAHLVQDRDLAALRWTVDTAADFRMVEAVFAALLPANEDFLQSDILDLLAAHPEIAAINAPDALAP
jgi:spore coat polysaccharide biosynthesis protein SpsF